ncbi:MAG: phosphatase PAP2 family protein [Candidatus Micrarchaeia archaeon]
MSDYRKLFSDFMKESRSRGVVDYIVKGSLLVYTILLLTTPITVGRIPALTPEQAVFLVLTYAVFVGKGMGFIKDIAPLVILFFAYEAMRGVVIAGEQRVITDYWAVSNYSSGLEVKINPMLVNVGETFVINVTTSDEVEYVDFVARKNDSNKEVNFTIKLLEGNGSDVVERDSELFGETGLYNITARARGYEGINGSAVVGVTKNVHYKEPIELERSLFGMIPTVYLQEKFYKEGKISAIDWIAIITYILHLPLPFFFASLIWFKDREMYKKYSATFLILAYTGLLTFLLYPASPPWLSGLVGYLDGVKKLYHEISQSLNLIILPTLYYWINANEVAAVPSLHAAFPLLISIYSFKLWGKRGLVVLLYPVATAFSLVYLGEHYAVDVLLGFVYVFASIVFVELLFRWERR